MIDGPVWLVVAEFEPEKVTIDFDGGEEYLRERFCEEYDLDREAADEHLGLDMKLREWCITYKRVRQRGFHMRRIETL